MALASSYFYSAKVTNKTIRIIRTTKPIGRDNSAYFFIPAMPFPLIRAMNVPTVKQRKISAKITGMADAKLSLIEPTIMNNPTVAIPKDSGIRDKRIS
jgi:hypothetical protein